MIFKITLEKCPFYNNSNLETMFNLDKIENVTYIGTNFHTRKTKAISCFNSQINCKISEDETVANKSTNWHTEVYTEK